MADEIDAATVRTVRGIQRDGCRRVVVVVTRLDDASLLAAVEAGACGMLRRSEADADRVVEAVLTAAKGDGSVPPDLLGRLLDQMSRLQRQVLAPRGLSLSGFTDREVDVLRLLGEGWDTAEIAGKLAYSERTVKNVIHDITARHQLRNRSARGGLRGAPGPDLSPGAPDPQPPRLPVRARGLARRSVRCHGWLGR